MYKAIPSKIIKFLEKQKIKYEDVKHRTVYTAYDKAATLRLPQKVIGKTLILKTDRDFVLALVPANKNLDKNKFKKVVNSWRKKQNLKPVKNIDFISEKLMKNKFQGVKIGAIPPFGDLWKLPTLIDRELLKEKSIFINSGIHEASFGISPKIFEKIGGILGNFSKAK